MHDGAIRNIEGSLSLPIQKIKKDGHSREHFYA